MAQCRPEQMAACTRDPQGHHEQLHAACGKHGILGCLASASAKGSIRVCMHCAALPANGQRLASSLAAPPQEIHRGIASSCKRAWWKARHVGELGEYLCKRKHSGLHALCCIACKWAKTRILACCPSTRAPLSNERKHLVQSRNRLCQRATNGTKNFARVLDNSLPNIQS
jgi:hypothetical protein